MKELEDRIPKREILKMYGIDRMTFDEWVRERGLPVIKISSHSKYIRRSDLEKWENSLIENNN